MQGSYLGGPVLNDAPLLSHTLTLTHTLSLSRARARSLFPLGQIVSIDGTNVCGMSFDELKALFAGDVGSTLTLLVLRSAASPVDATVEQY